MEELIKQVKEMRAAQREYAKSKNDWQLLQVCRVLEMRVDKIIENYGQQ